MKTACTERSINPGLIALALLFVIPLTVLAVLTPSAAKVAAPLDSTDRVEYVTKLSLIQGHLWVAAQLVEAGHMELGARHAKHPGEEVYQELLPFFAATNSRGFAAELEAMSHQFHGYSMVDFRRAYMDVMSAIDDIVRAQNLDGRAKLQVVSALVDQASIEYRAGISDGVVVDLQEYQDARGFIEVAQELLTSSSPLEGYAGDQQTKLLEQLSAVKKLWPSLMPGQEVLGDGTGLALLTETLESALGGRQAAQ